MLIILKIQFDISSQKGSVCKPFYFSPATLAYHEAFNYRVPGRIVSPDSGLNRASPEVSLDWSIAAADCFAVDDCCDAAVGCKLLLPLLLGHQPTSACVAGRGRHAWQR